MTKRRRFSSEQKAVIVRRHLGGKVPVSDLADEMGLQPSQIHLWVKQVLEQAERAFSCGRRATSNPEKHLVAKLQDALERKDALLAELLHQISRLLVDQQTQQA